MKNPLYANPHFGNAGGSREFISYEARALVVEKILTLATASETQDALRQIGHSRGVRGVMLWMKQTRQWLGLPPVYPSPVSDPYREAVALWIQENGFPTREQILEGWLPGRGDVRAMAEDAPEISG